MKSRLFTLLLILFTGSAMGHLFAQELERLEPAFWWVGMNNPSLQLLVYGQDISQLHPVISYAGVNIKQVIKVENPNYLFIDLYITAEARPGTFPIEFKRRQRTVIRFDYRLLAREPNSAMRGGLDGSDVMYLITPDRFANGDPGNDVVTGLKETLNRSEPFGRHGGDIKGIVDRLDYLKDMGFSTIWLNPVLENDMAQYSYHGYSTTDFYKVDSRFGTNEDYRNMAAAARDNGIKLVMDMIVNHCGSEHWWMADPPASDWINNPIEYVQTNHRKSTIQDPYVSKVDYHGFVDGWFVPTMPDLNQRNPFMATYLIQNSIWWIEYAHLAGIRMDTYPYPDMDFLTEWTCQIQQEYPDFYIVGEEWHGNPAIVAHWQQGKINPNGYTSCLPGLMDFPLQEALRKSLTAEEGWGSGWINLYEMLANDFQYPDPMRLVVFPDNHDMDRFFTQVGEDLELFKLGLAYILTVRGIPQLYYGTEVLMSNNEPGNHGIIRSDFPGGWAQDAADAVSGRGLSEAQQDAKSFLHKLLNWRKQNPVVHYGKLLHFIPENGVYVFFRYSDRGKVMVVLNKNNEPQTLDLTRFREALHGVSKGNDVISGEVFDLSQPLQAPGRTPLILELQ